MGHVYPAAMSTSPDTVLSPQKEQIPIWETKTSVFVQVVVQPLSFEIYKSSLGTVTYEFIFTLGGGNLLEKFMVILENSTQVTEGLRTRNLWW